MLRVPKYPQAPDVPAAELERNTNVFRKLFQMAAERGLDTPHHANESITGARDFISKGGSATYLVEIPADGDYPLQVTGSGGGFSVLVDESNCRSTSAVYHLGAGPHSVGFFGKQAGARVEYFTLVPSLSGKAR